MTLHANGLPFRCLIDVPGGRTEQRDILADDIWNAWNDALELLRRHGLDMQLPRRTLDAMGHVVRP